MKIGILQTGHAPESLISEHGDYNDMFTALLGGQGFTFDTYAVVDGQMPDSVHDAQGWIITGSRHGVYEPHGWIAPLEDFIRACFTADIPVLGICFGHQIMAQALGGKVEKYSGGWSVGNTDYALKDGNHLKLLAWHQDQVVELPAGAETIASTDHCRYAALSYGKKGLSFQPHPEFDQAFLRGLLETRGSVLPQDIKQQAYETVDEDLSTDKIIEMFTAFLKSGEKPA